MRPPAVTLVTLGLLLMGPDLTRGLFEDQAFKFDWRLRQVGVPFASSFVESSSGKGGGLMVATGSNVLAVLNHNTGDIKWRHQLSQQAGQQLVDFGMSPSGKRASTLVVTNEREMSVQTWNPANGLLSAETSVNLQTVDKKPDWGVLLGNEVAAIYSEPGANSLGLKVEAYCSKTGAFLRKNTFTLPVPMTTTPKCIKTLSVFACVSLEDGMLYHFRLPAEPSDGVSAVSLEALGVAVSSAAAAVSPIPKMDAISIAVDSKAYVLSFHRGKFTGAKTLLASDKASNLVLTGCNSDGDDDGDESTAGMLSIQASHADGTALTIMAVDANGQPVTSERAVTVRVDAGRGSVVGAVASCGGGRGGGHASQPYTRLMLQFADGSVSSVSDGGDVFWTRDEGLASLEDVLLVDTGEHVVFDEDTFAGEAGSYGEALYSETTSSDKRTVVGQVVRRIRHHASQLNGYFTHLIAAKKDFGSLLAGLGQSASRPDLFGIRKMVVAVSGQGKVYGLDSRTGRIMWSFLLADGVCRDCPNPPKMFLQRTAHHFGLDPVAAVVYQGQAGFVRVQSFNPLNGKTSDQPRKDVGSSYAKAFLLHHANADMIRPLVVVGPASVIAVEPNQPLGYLKSLSGKMFVTTVDGTRETEKLVGHRVIVEEGKALPTLHPMWSIASPGAKVVSLSGKPSDQVVHSQGRVMADRSVLFKYVNPNLGLLLAEGKDASSKNFINVYLIDLVTGRIVFSVTHKRVAGPYHVVHSENWAVYTYYNEKSRRAELASLELYEGKTQSNATVFSSLHNNISPLVERQSFILGPSHVTSLSETETEKGITTKHLLMATSTGAVYDIPKHLLDPRRPNVNTPADQREPGLPPYIPELQMPPEAILNYNQTVLSVRGITTAPTELESTSVVFVHGLDLYCTSMTPSKGFDLLNDDFDYYVISSVLMALIAAAFVTKKMSQRKALNQAWR